MYKTLALAASNADALSTYEAALRLDCEAALLVAAASDEEEIVAWLRSAELVVWSPSLAVEELVLVHAFALRAVVAHLHVA